LGAFEYSVEVGDSNGRRFERLITLVDTGATYTTIPRDVLARLGVLPEEERPFILANGQRVSYGMAWIRVRIDEREQPTLAVFGNEGVKPLLGAFTLEGFGLAVDTVNKRLVPAAAYLVGLRDPGQK
jgi:predicted aspartyl protease